MGDPRERILSRLREQRHSVTASPLDYRKPMGWNREQRVAAFTERMHAVRGEVHRVGADQWVDWLIGELPQRGLRRALVGTGPDIAAPFAAAASSHFELRRFDAPIEQWKAALFRDVDFSLTGAYAGLAESGSLVLLPDAQEPRLMSLVPPVHVAILRTERLYDNFADMLGSENWASGMPTNALLISGPSKTADIEQTLAYGIHGPKQLITLLVD